MSSRPRLPVAVVIAAYNRAELIPRALRGIDAQVPALPAEVIVVDDGSSDATAEVAERLGARVIRHELNRGESAARNTGIAAASQPWIAVLDSDDEWLPTHLDALWRRHDGKVLVATAALACGEDPEEDRVNGSPRRQDVLLGPEDILFPENVIPGSGVLLRREVALAAGGYDEGMLRCEDLDLLVRCLEHGPGVAAPDVTVLYHLHEGQLSNDRDEMRAMHTLVAERYADRPWWSRRQVARWRTVAAWDAYRGGGGIREAARALAHPVALTRLLSWRLRVRRRSARVGRDGRPSVALMPGAGNAPAGSARVVDLRAQTRINALARLARRPAGSAVAGSAFDALALRALGIRRVSR